MARQLTADGRLSALVVRGTTLQAHIRTAVTSASLSLSTGGPTTLNLSVDDPDLGLLASGIFARGSAIDYADLELQLRAVVAADGGSGPALAITGRSDAWCRLKSTRGKRVWKKTRPSSVVRLLGKSVGLTVVAQDSAVKRQITRGKYESSQGLIERMASDLNFTTFESAGTLYFGTLTWLVARSAAVKRPIVWDRIARTGTAIGDLRAMPEMTRSEDSPRGAAELRAEFIGDDADSWRPGHVIPLKGIPGFDGDYLVVDVGIPLDNTSPVTVSAVLPKKESKSSDVPPAREVAKPTAALPVAATDFGEPPVQALVDAALTYVAGTTAPEPVSDPTNPFTGAELVSWCAARAGATINGTPAQMLALARSKKAEILLEQGESLRGALLFTADESQVGVSLGGGRAVAAVGRRYAVVSGTIPWSTAALVPGLKYPKR